MVALKGTGATNKQDNASTGQPDQGNLSVEIFFQGDPRLFKLMIKTNQYKFP